MAQNRGPRVAVEVAVPAAEDGLAERLARAWAEKVLAELKQNAKLRRAASGLVAGLTPWAGKTWARTVLEQLKHLHIRWKVRAKAVELLRPKQ